MASRFRSGVTTVVDAGSSGWRNFGEFRDEIINHEKTRVFAMLNIVGSGMGGRPDVEQNTKDMDPQRTAEVARRHQRCRCRHQSGALCRARMDRCRPRRRGRKLADIPVMVDFATFRPERPFQDLVLKHLRPGDIYTHEYLPSFPCWMTNGMLLPVSVRSTQARHHLRCGTWRRQLLLAPGRFPPCKQGFLPDSISTDLHIDSMNAGMKDMLNLMSKFLNMGMSLDDVIARSTWHPAREIHHEELGHLSVGAPADVAVLRLVNGQFRLRRFRPSPASRQSQAGCRIDTARRENRVGLEWDEQ